MKNPRRTLVVNLILAVLLTGLLIGATFVEDLNGTSLKINGLSLGFSSGGDCLTSDESYEKRSEGEVSISDVGSLNIGWTAGKIEIVPTEGDTIRFFEKSEKDLEDKQIMRWKNEDGTLSIRFGTKGGWFRNDPEKTLTIELPADLIVDHLTIQTVSADLSLPSVSTSDFSFDTVSGNFFAESIIAVTVDLDGVSGGVRLNKIDCDFLSIDSVSANVTLPDAFVRKKLDASTVSGEISFEGRADEFSWDTTSGDAELTFTDAGSSIEIDSTSGDATVTLPADTSGFKAEIDSTSGELTSDFDLSHHDDYVRYGDGKLEIEMDTASGDLRIKKGS